MEKKLHLALLHSLGISHKKLHLIFWENLLWWRESYQEFYEWMNSEILLWFWIKEKDVSHILMRKKSVTLEYIRNKITERNVNIITVEDDNYPEWLRHISHTPYILYVRWIIPKRKQFAIVGARKISSYWVRAIESIIPELSKFFPIVSWGAYGCDSVAHWETLKHWNITVSVLGTSICEDYPTGNKKMYDDIVNNWGAVLSIFAIWVPWNAYNFPIRNEIVVGLSVWVLVIEAQEKSWSLITAQLALDMGKDLFSIPGEIFKSNSSGCNRLIKKWEAKMVTSALDVLEEYNFSTQKNTKNIVNKIEFWDEIEELIYNTLLLEWFSIDELAKKLKIDISTLSFKLSMLEIRGIIKKTLWWQFEIKQ